MPTRRVVAVVAAVVAAVIGIVAAAYLTGRSAATGSTWLDPTTTHAPANGLEGTNADRLIEKYELVDLMAPARTEVRRRTDQAVVASLTAGARTVVFAGPHRRFTEPSATPAVVDSTFWVRLAPGPWQPTPRIDEEVAGWLLSELERKKPPTDILAASMQYLAGAADGYDERGVRYVGDAGFGYVHTADERDGADFFDYLEIPWTFPDDSRVKPSSRWDRDLDCSGYIRLIYGYRFGLPLLNKPVTTTVDGLPRTAASMAAYARSVLIAAGRSSGTPPSDLSAMQPGDIVFFALHDNPNTITHSGIYIGEDQYGGKRFVSSRGTVDGPSFGDVRGDGVVDSGYFGKRLRRVIRL